jgi:hypothetical protein
MFPLLDYATLVHIELSENLQQDNKANDVKRIGSCTSLLVIICKIQE